MDVQRVDLIETLQVNEYMTLYQVINLGSRPDEYTNSRLIIGPYLINGLHPLSLKIVGLHYP